jgi:primosomal protein N' (replication factor Y)
MPSPPRYLRIAVALPVHGTFTYRLPEALGSGACGQRALVPFGPRRVTGYILEAVEAPEVTEVKDILAILDEEPLFPGEMLPFFEWVARYYHHPLGEVIQTALPGGLTLQETHLVAIAADECRLPDPAGLPALEREILDCLRRGACRPKDLAARLGRPVSGALLQSMEACGWVRRSRELRGNRVRPRLERFVRLAHPAPPQVRLTAPRKAILELLARQGATSLRELARQRPGAAGVVRAMAGAGLVEVEERPVYRDPFGDTIRPDTPPTPNAEQTAALAAVTARAGRGFSAFILEGVTGSGKTEVYLRLAQTIMARGGTVLVLVPEIALIAQMEQRFRARFGEKVAVLHSGLSRGERLDQWTRLRRREVPIAIGARSAIFAPLTGVGLIVVDEEHDSSYKQDSGLRYNARDLALVRARLLACPVVLGSATPSLQSIFHVRQGRYRPVRLTARVADRPLPQVSVVDLRQHRHLRGSQRFITPELRQAMAETLAQGDQVLLFLNRRGFASYPVCAACGQALVCRNCQITLTLHQRANAYRCHYCGYSRPSTTPCPACGSSRIRHLGLGTEKVEDAVTRIFPEARVARMDRDTTAGKGAVVRLLRGLKHREIDILIGTQMVAKGHHFPDITLVGIICAETSLNFPDFRAGERTFQLIAQVAGRAGRGDRPGRVILQTYAPDHFSIAAACRQDLHAFYEQEIQHRRLLNYPPYTRLVQLILSGPDRRRAEEAARSLGERCRALRTNASRSATAVEVLGPLEAPLPKIGGRYRWQILLKCQRAEELHRFLDELRAEMPAGAGGGDLKLVVDVDPVFML